MRDACRLGLTQDSDKCKGSSCLTCGWNPAVEAQRKAALRKYGPKALMKRKTAEVAKQ